MRKKTFPEEQIVLALRIAEMGTPVTEVYRKMEIRSDVVSAFLRVFRML